MPVGRGVLLLRRLSSGDNKFINLNLNQNTTKESLLANPLCIHRDLDISRRISFVRHNNITTLELKRNYSSDNIFKMTWSSSESNTKDNPKHTNRLITEKSPYLLQHAHNPVEWYPWCQEAIDKAKNENKLIFLSVGYSTCHWCHVMEKESFENESVAKVMNEHFVNIKVDREERPDIDRVYMMFVMATTGGGGWPMSVFLTPDLRPVTGGTYFPPEDKWGRPGFKSILLSIATRWKDNQADFIQVSNNIMVALIEMSEANQENKPDVTPGEEICIKSVNSYIKRYEPNYGGFGKAPKFPQASIFNFLIHYYARDKYNADGKKCLEMCLYTLTKIANGGIHDHIAGGFSRYSVDNEWHVPHFEKMLYDQAQLVVAYTDAYLATKDEFYAGIVRDIIKYVNRDLRHESGGYYSAEDADSYPFEGASAKKEGAFYVWDYNDIERLLGDKLIGSTSYLDIFCDYFNVETAGNISPLSDPHGELKKQNVLIVYGSKQETMNKFGLTLEQFNQVLEESTHILNEERLKRPRPHLDTKMLCSWNGLMLAGLARAGQGLGEKSFIDDALKTAQFIRDNLYDPETKTLVHSCYRAEDGSIAQNVEPIPGFLDDYAFLIKGLLDLYEASFDLQWLNWARELQLRQNELFWDDDSGGYYTCSNDDATVVLRLKEDQDGAEPSGNSVSCHNLQRLAVYADKSEPAGGDAEREMAKKLLLVFSFRMKEMPMSLPEMISALMFYNDSPTQVLIAGRQQDERTLALVRAVRSRLLAGRVLAVHDPDAPLAHAGMSDILLGNIKSSGDVPTAYVCRRFACSLPVTDVKQLENLLDEPPQPTK